MADRDPLPEHSPVPHDPGYWMTQTCERCRRQAEGQRRLLAALLPEHKFDAIYNRQKADRG